MVVIFFIIFLIIENLCKVLLIWIEVIVVFGREDNRIWCKELFKVVLYLCLSGFIINFLYLVLLLILIVLIFGFLILII